MAYWLLKSEPAKYSWNQMVADGRTHWDGVRNFQASNNLRAMRDGDRAFFYHSNEGKEIVGVVKIVRTFYPDPGDPNRITAGANAFRFSAFMRSRRWCSAVREYVPSAA